MVPVPKAPLDRVEVIDRGDSRRSCARISSSRSPEWIEGLTARPTPPSPPRRDMTPRIGITHTSPITTPLFCGCASAGRHRVVRIPPISAITISPIIVALFCRFASALRRHRADAISRIDATTPTALVVGSFARFWRRHANPWLRSRDFGARSPFSVGSFAQFSVLSSASWVRFAHFVALVASRMTAILAGMGSFAPF
jgi:hypothetical protein